MTMQTDVRAAHLNTSGVAYAGRARIKGFICTATGTNTEIIVYDDSAAATGEVLMRFDSGTTVTTFSILVPGEGVLARNGIYIDLGGGGVTLTVFYG